MGLQSIRVKTKRGFVMLAADAVHLYPHLDEARIFPTTYNLAEVLEGYETLKRLASSRHHIVPGHDPAVMKIYPAPTPRLPAWWCGSTSIRRCEANLSVVMPALVGSIRVVCAQQDVDGRDKPGHGVGRSRQSQFRRTHRCDARRRPG